MGPKGNGNEDDIHFWIYFKFCAYTGFVKTGALEVCGWRATWLTYFKRSQSENG